MGRKGEAEGENTTAEKSLTEKSGGRRQETGEGTARSYESEARHKPEKKRRGGKRKAAWILIKIFKA